jgi:hypothetical protein
MKIAICMWYNSKISGYADKCAFFNNKYCRINNYEFLCSSFDFKPDKSPSYNKLPFVLNILKTNRYDYVVWVDADAFFRTTEKLENYIMPYLDKDIIWSADCSSDDDINCGVCIFKNTDYTKDFLHYWDTEPLPNPYPKWWEQGILRYIYAENLKDIKSHSTILPYGTLQDFKIKGNGYIYHLAGKSHNKRLEYMNNLNI